MILYKRLKAWQEKVGGGREGNWVFTNQACLGTRVWGLGLGACQSFLAWKPWSGSIRTELRWELVTHVGSVGLTGGFSESHWHPVTPKAPQNQHFIMCLWDAFPPIHHERWSYYLQRSQRKADGHSVTCSYVSLCVCVCVCVCVSVCLSVCLSVFRESFWSTGGRNHCHGIYPLTTVGNWKNIHLSPPPTPASFMFLGDGKTSYLLARELSRRLKNHKNLFMCLA